MRDHLLVQRMLEIPRDWDDRIAFDTPTASLRFAALRDRMLRFAGWLVVKAGVRPGDRVALCLPKTIEAVTCQFGILASGAA